MMTDLTSVVIGNALAVVLATTAISLMGTTISGVLLLRRHDRTLYGEDDEDDGLVDDVNEHRDALREEGIL